jgi:hypothetical protein
MKPYGGAPLWRRPRVALSSSVATQLNRHDFARAVQAWDGERYAKGGRPGTNAWQWYSARGGRPTRCGNSRAAWRRRWGSCRILGLRGVPARSTLAYAKRAPALAGVSVGVRAGGGPAPVNVPVQAFASGLGRLDDRVVRADQAVLQGVEAVPEGQAVRRDEREQRLFQAAPVRRGRRSWEVWLSSTTGRFPVFPGQGEAVVVDDTVGSGTISSCRGNELCASASRSRGSQDLEGSAPGRPSRSRACGGSTGRRSSGTGEQTRCGSRAKGSGRRREEGGGALFPAGPCFGPGAVLGKSGPGAPPLPGEPRRGAPP